VTHRRASVLALGDLTALLVFALVGLASHDEGITLAGVARTWLPIAGCYALAALAFGAWTHVGLWRVACAWAVGVAAGVLVRALALGRSLDGDQLQFLAVALATTLVLLTAWRGTEHAMRRARRGVPG
jgi:hypothetical protein